MTTGEHDDKGPPAAGNGGRLQKSDWLAAARGVLIEAGYAKVKIDLLAKALGVTRGSFYWHFASRDELLDSLVVDWENTNSTAIFAALRQAGTPVERIRALGQVWLDEKGYSPAYDSAMRDWARVEPAVQRVVERVDDARIAAIEALFSSSGYPPEQAFIRARITYFHQVGYYAMGVKETRDTRDRYLGVYIEVLMGKLG